MNAKDTRGARGDSTSLVPRGGDNSGPTPRGGIGGFIRSLLSGIPWSERAEERLPLRLDAPKSGMLRVDNANGRTRVIGEERADLLIEIHKQVRAESPEQAALLLEKTRLLHRESDDGGLELEVEVLGRWNRRGRVNLDIHVPRGTTVGIASTNGRIFLSGLRAAVRLHSSNGPVRVNDVVGDIEIHTSNARVHTQCTCGKLMARSSNGRIELAEHRGSVDAATSNGTIHCGLEDLGQSGCVLITSNGRICLDLPKDVDGNLDVRVDNGLIRCARELKSGARERSGRLKGTLGRGGAPIRLRASNGTVNLR